MTGRRLVRWALTLVVLLSVVILVAGPAPAGERGRITAGLEPAGAVDSGAAWSVDNGRTWLPSDLEMNLDTGDYTVIFKPLPGWAVPPPVEVHLPPDRLLTVSGRYAPLPRTGRLTVRLGPDQVLEGDAAWSLDQGSTWLIHGQEVELDPGSYRVVFKPVSGWARPRAMDIELAAGQTVNVSASYGRTGDGPMGRLRVDLETAGARRAGAQWTINAGTTWHNSGETVSLSPNRYVIIFRKVEGYREPWHLETRVEADRTTTERGIYTLN